MLGDDMSREVAEAIEVACAAINQSAPAVAEANWVLYSELREQGFSDEQAFELVRSMEFTDA